MCIYIYIYTHIYIHTHIYKHTSIHVVYLCTKAGVLDIATAAMRAFGSALRECAAISQMITISSSSISIMIMIIVSSSSSVVVSSSSK